MNSIKVINFDKVGGEKKERVVKMFPDILRCGIFGPSGCGKTNVLMTILLHVRPFRDVYLCSKTSYQEKYSKLRELANSYNKSNKNKISIHDVVVLPEPENVPPRSIVIFDDILTENQDKIANFFLRGRHREISCFYLAQSYTKIPKKSGIRENFNYLILFRQDQVNLRQIYTEYVTDLNFEQFRQLCDKCWREQYGFLVVDLESSCKYKKKFEQCL